VTTTTNKTKKNPNKEKKQKNNQWKDGMRRPLKMAWSEIVLDFRYFIYSFGFDVLLVSDRDVIAIITKLNQI